MDTLMLEKEKKHWDKISKVKDFLTFLEDPNMDVMALMRSLADPSKSGFWVAANVNFDINIDKILQEEPNIRHDEVSSVTRTPSEILHHKEYNFTNGYDRFTPPADILKIAKALGFNNKPSCWINNQKPGTMLHRHIDFVSCYTYERSDDADFLELEYDKVRRQAKGHPPIYRCFVALDDWHPGQIVNFEPDFWHGWKKGDVMFFDWQNTPHSTANCGIKDRPLLKITGTLDDDSFVKIARETGKIKNIKI